MIMKIYILTFIISTTCTCTQLLSRKHRDSTPFVDDAVHSLWNDDPSSDVLVGMPIQSSSSRFEDACSFHFCERGKSCRVTWDGTALCECKPFCPHHRKLVCGTDDRLFLNHCELHRTACLEKKKIHIDRSKRCFHKGTKLTFAPKISSNTQEEKIDSFDEPPEYMPIYKIKENKSETMTESFLYNTKNEEGNKKCDQEKYDIFKEKILALHHSKLLSKKSDSTEREYLVGLMFSHFDTNNNGNLDETELEEVSEDESIQRLSRTCFLSHLIKYDDKDGDQRMSLNEFYSAFSVSVVSLDKSLEINTIMARVGDNLEIKCDVTGTPSPPIVWRRHGLDLAALNSEDIRVFADGSLYLTKLQLVHDGNYTCHADRNEDIVQTHILRIHTAPTVAVNPNIKSLAPGEEAIMRCRATGEPFPKVEWLKNDEPLRLDIPHKYSIIGNGSRLHIRNIGYADTGAYMCQASSVGGTARDISSLVVQENPEKEEIEDDMLFFVFHDSGVSVYEPSECRLHHVIQGTDIIPGTQEYVCGDKGTNCTWGRAISVGQRYIYTSQPTRDRVLVISTQQMVVVDVIVTDQYPVDLSYIENLDQVWVLNWRSVQDEGVKTIQVIRDASQKKKHHTVHPEPIDGHFDLVKNLFVPGSQDLGHEFRYAYVTHTNQRGLYKLDLANMKYVKTVDLTPYNCVPQEVIFSSLHGLVIMECAEPITGRRTGQLVMDYLTDAVISHKLQLLGKPHIFSDSSLVVTIDNRKRIKIYVQKVTEKGLDYLYDVSTSLNISDITAFPSQLSHSYDLFAASTDKDDILILDLKSGKVEVMTGVGKAMDIHLTEWGNTNRIITSSGIFGKYLVSPSKAAIYVLNGESHTVNCEISSPLRPRLVVWISKKLV